MRRAMLSVLALAMVLAAAGCALSLPVGDKGVVGMIPFWNEEMGIQGVMPLEGWSDRAALLQQSAPVAMDELVAEIVAQTDLVTLPRSTGTYRGATFSWDLYKIETQLPDVGPGIYRLDLALAEGDGASYFVALVTEPMGYAAHAPMYEAVFKHALYAFAPMEVEE